MCYPTPVRIIDSHSSKKGLKNWYHAIKGLSDVQER